jgi:hypothetical protein
MSLSGRPPPSNKRRERITDPRSRRKLIGSHGRSKRWLDLTVKPQTTIAATHRGIVLGVHLLAAAKNSANSLGSGMC